MSTPSTSSKEEVSAHIGNVVRSEVNKNADYDLEQWVQERVLLRPGDSVLDIGCGNGKQVAVFSGLVGDTGKVTGIDIFGQVPGLLENAKAKLAGKTNIELVDHSASQPFPQKDNSFEVITSCYSIYYVDDIRATLKECYRLLKPGGRCFVVGPAWDNSKEFYDEIRNITGRDLPKNFAERLWRINNEVIPAAYEIFSRVEVSPFVNRVFFEGAEGIKSVADYYRHSLLFEEASPNADEREKFAAEFVRRVEAQMKKNGRYVMFKRAVGLTMYREPRS
jgi:ubiquinone/menaquinone biosynthesis C-methylase UbiE